MKNVLETHYITVIKSMVHQFYSLQTVRKINQAFPGQELRTVNLPPRSDPFLYCVSFSLDIYLNSVKSGKDVASKYADIYLTALEEVSGLSPEFHIIIEAFVLQVTALTTHLLTASHMSN